MHRICRQTREPIEETGTNGMNILFICSYNKWRSPTAEQVWRKHPGLNVRSAGTSARARRAVSEADIVWAEPEEQWKDGTTYHFDRHFAWVWYTTA